MAATSTARCPMSASSLNKDEIKNHQDETLGSVHDIMLDCDSGRVAYVVMSSGGFLGLGNKLFAIPMTSLSLDRDEKCFRLDARKETFEKAEGFDQNNWPNMTDPNWETKTHKHFGTQPYWENRPL